MSHSFPNPLKKGSSSKSTTPTVGSKDHFTEFDRLVRNVNTNASSKGKVAELRSELEAGGKKDKNHTAKKTALKKIVANMTMNNNDMVVLFPDVVNQMRIPNMEVKKMCFLFLTNYARMKPDVALRALPILVEVSIDRQTLHAVPEVLTSIQDLTDSNPLIRALALRTISYVHVKEFVEATIQPVQRLLKDDDPYVRKTAAITVAKLYDHDRHLIERSDLIDRLNSMLRDGNPTVVSSALAALVDIWQRSDNIKLTIDYGNASNIVQILPDCSEWGQTYILEALMSYVPQETSEAAVLAERIAPRLSHTNSGVVMTCVRVLMYLFNYIEDDSVVEKLSQKLSPPLVTLLSKGPEIQYLALRNALLILQRYPEVLRNDIRVFFCKYNDPIYVKVTKLELIFMLASENNIKEVLTELKEYSTEIDIHFVRKSVRAIGKLAIKIEKAAQPCIDVLLELVSTRVSYIVQEATVVIRNIFRKYPNRYEGIISTLCEHLDSLDEPEAKSAMIWIIGQYADRIENSEVLLDDFLYSFKEETYEVQLALLTATVKLFIHRPTKGSELVPKVLKWATEESDHPDLRERGFFYWRLLSYNNASEAREIVMGYKPPITAESEKLDAATLEEMCLNVGTLATVYLKPVHQVFRQARTHKLQDSPALQKHRLPTNMASGTSADQSPDLSNGTGRGQGQVGQANLAAAVDAADEYFSNMGPQGMANMSVADDNLMSPVGGAPNQGGMIVNQYPPPQHHGGQNDDLLL
ncbi:MAG: hypothetical protein M1831_004865 [Alyxoria varia]|nr:MAG: hypothetical protein M1831_004865 [Alyxoria varia]